MGTYTSSMTPGEMTRWAARVAADDWAWVTWKFLLGELALILLWASFLFVFLSTFFPRLRMRMAANGFVVTPSYQVSAFLITWLIGDLMVPSTFGSGPIAYWIHSSFSNSVEIEAWCNQYLTLFGLIQL